MVIGYLFPVVVAAGAALDAFRTPTELAAATLPATARKCLRLTFEESEFLDMKFSSFSDSNNRVT
jgi:hypothetical protein